MEIPYVIRFGRNPDPNIVTATATRAGLWSDAYTWRCPELMSLVLRPGDTFSARLFAAAAEIAAPDALVMIEVRDARNRFVSRIFGASNYLSITEFVDVKARARLQIVTEVILTPKTLLVVMINDDVAMTTADLTTRNFGVIETHRIGG
ncbi:MAG: hypothetical protein DDT31_01134 [Syntrophomonadaceae bacterium]|nr:hypothetical protein [Bacillota bacterium]